MNQTSKSIVTACATIILLAGLSACKKPEGPAERLGKDIDNATQKAGQEVEKAGEKIQDATKQ
ncbi:MAG: hypothetical protein ABIO19_05165 [Burkholderiaceae bacterium]